MGRSGGNSAPLRPSSSYDGASLSSICRRDAPLWDAKLRWNGKTLLIGDGHSPEALRLVGEVPVGTITFRPHRTRENELVVGTYSAASVRQAATLGDFGSKPLSVVTAGQGNSETWLAAQNKLAALSTNSQHRVVADATHASLVLDKTHSAAASQGIRDVVAAVRSSRPLE